MSEQVEHALRVKQENEDRLLAKAGVIGVGVGLRQRAGHFEDEVCLVVSVRHKLPADQLTDQDLLPPHIDGVPVDVQEVGDVTRD
ncbi:MAG: hypothetical protein GYB68_17110 [Chloroflexi bacterium]|nr:hypothetical protein [Chloroflexota bacterium]